MTQVDTPLGIFIPIFFVYGIGLGLAIIQLTNVVLSNIPPQFAGTGSGVNNMLRQVGAAIGVAILTSLVTAVSTDHLRNTTTIPPTIKPIVQQLVNQGQPKDVVVAVVNGIVTGHGKPPAGTSIGKHARHTRYQW